MAMTALGGIHRYPDTLDLTWQQNGLTFTFDTSTDLLAVVFRIPYTGTIDKVHYHVDSVSSPVLTLRCELRTVSATTGLPDGAGTLYGSSTSITAANPTTGNKTALVNATATKSDICALTFDLSAFTSGSVTLLRALNYFPFGNWGFYPYDVANTTGSTAKATFQFNAFSLEYSGPAFHPLEASCICGANAAAHVHPLESYQRVGNRFRPPVAMRAVGIWAAMDIRGSCYLRLRAQADDSLLATVTIDSDQVYATSSTGTFQFLFDGGTTVDLSAATDYYVLAENNASQYVWMCGIGSIPAQAHLDQLAGGQNCYGTMADAATGTYTDSTTTRYAIGILMDAVDVGGAGGLAMPVSGSIVA